MIAVENSQKLRVLDDGEELLPVSGVNVWLSLWWFRTRCSPVQGLWLCQTTSWKCAMWRTSLAPANVQCPCTCTKQSSWESCPPPPCSHLGCGRQETQTCRLAYSNTPIQPLLANQSSDQLSIQNTRRVLRSIHQQPFLSIQLPNHRQHEWHNYFSHTRPSQPCCWECPWTRELVQSSDFHQRWIWILYIHWAETRRHWLSWLRSWTISSLTLKWLTALEEWCTPVLFHGRHCTLRSSMDGCPPVDCTNSSSGIFHTSIHPSCRTSMKRIVCRCILSFHSVDPTSSGREHRRPPTRPMPLFCLDLILDMFSYIQPWNYCSIRSNILTCWHRNMVLQLRSHWYSP